MTACVRFHDNNPKGFSLCDILQPGTKIPRYESAEIEESAKMMRMTEVNSHLAQDILSKNRQCQDMHMKLFEATVTNSRLMDQMSQLAVENQQLRLQMLAIREENEELHSHLSFNSSTARWANGGFKRWFQGGAEHPDIAESPVGSPESWEEVSQKLLNQMQQEMKEMQDLDQKLAAENGGATLESDYTDHGTNGGKSVSTNQPDMGMVNVDLERVKTLLQSLKGQSEHLKGQLENQSIVLQSAVNQLKKATKSGAVVLRRKSGTGAATSDASKNKFERPSDELFRAYFTQQLHNSSGSQQCQRSGDAEERSNPETGNKEKNNSDLSSSRTTREASPEEKICPICDASFPYETPLDDFQNHVMDHFENENSTLMQQYELL